MDLQDGREIEGVLDRLEPVPLKRRPLTSVCSKKELWRRLSESVTTHPTLGVTENMKLEDPGEELVCTIPE